jgi:hypothetical protein
MDSSPGVVHALAYGRSSSCSGQQHRTHRGPHRVFPIHETVSVRSPALELERPSTSAQDRSPQHAETAGCGHTLRTFGTFNLANESDDCALCSASVLNTRFKPHLLQFMLELVCQAICSDYSWYIHTICEQPKHSTRFEGWFGREKEVEVFGRFVILAIRLMHKSQARRPAVG